MEMGPCLCISLQFDSAHPLQLIVHKAMYVVHAVRGVASAFPLWLGRDAKAWIQFFGQIGDWRNSGYVLNVISDPRAGIDYLYRVHSTK